MPAAAVIPAELGMGNFVAVKTFVVTVKFYFLKSLRNINFKIHSPRLN